MKRFSGLLVLALTLASLFSLVGLPKINKEASSAALKAMANKVEPSQCQIAKGSSSIELLCGCIRADENFVARFNSAVARGEKKKSDLGNLETACQRYYVTNKAYASATREKERQEADELAKKLKKEIASVISNAAALMSVYNGTESVSLADLDLTPFDNSRIFKNQLPDKTGFITKNGAFGKGVSFKKDYTGHAKLENKFSQLVIASLVFPDRKKGKAPAANLKISSSSSVLYDSSSCGNDENCLSKAVSLDLTGVDELTLESSGNGVVGLPDSKLICLMPDCKVPPVDALPGKDSPDSVLYNVAAAVPPQPTVASPQCGSSLFSCAVGTVVNIGLANQWLCAIGASNVTCYYVVGVCGANINQCLAGNLLDLADSASQYLWQCVGSSSSGVTASCSAPRPQVNGLCGSTNNQCVAGTLSDTADSATQYLWQCLGSNGGSTASCSASRTPVNGQCGTSNNQCVAGTLSDTADSATQYSWQCLGSNGGSNASCLAPRPLVNGQCGSTNNQCVYGTLSDTADSATQYLWQCVGSNGGSTASCSASSTPVNGLCGSTNNQCVAGSLIDLADSTTQYLWRCVGSNGGSNASCSAVRPVAVNGRCGSTKNQCLAGTLSDTADSATEYIWKCLGQNGGSDASCSVLKPVNGLCGSIEQCSAGTYSAAADTETQYLWRCLGSNGGRNADCSAPRTVIGQCGSTNNVCLAGSLNDLADSTTQYLWQCVGSNGGSNSNCSALRPVNGRCGSTNNQCAAGTLSDTADSATQYFWRCQGSNGGSNASCSALRPVNGLCGSTNNQCVAGTLSDTADSATQYLWQCLGSNGGANSSCSALKPVNGLCGSTNNQCVAGRYNDAADSATEYLWRCLGLNGGSNANCSALIPPTPTPTFECTGPLPANATLCPGDDIGLSASVPRTVVNECSAPDGSEPKCEFECREGYAKDGDICKEHVLILLIGGMASSVEDRIFGLRNYLDAIAEGIRLNSNIKYDVQNFAEYATGAIWGTTSVQSESRKLIEDIGPRYKSKDFSKVYVFAHSFGNLLFRKAVLDATGDLAALFKKARYFAISPLLGGDGGALGIPDIVGSIAPNDLNPYASFQQNLFSEASVARFNSSITSYKSFIVSGSGEPEGILRGDAHLEGIWQVIASDYGYGPGCGVKTQSNSAIEKMKELWFPLYLRGKGNPHVEYYYPDLPQYPSAHGELCGGYADKAIQLSGVMGAQVSELTRYTLDPHTVLLRYKPLIQATMSEIFPMFP